MVQHIQDAGQRSAVAQPGEAAFGEGAETGNSGSIGPKAHR